jgi:hypothetical protein
LWLREYRDGREEGVKDRPCAVVVAVVDIEGTTRVTVLPITHSAPEDPTAGVEIPTDTKKRLGLDPERSWIVLSEGNEFIWPGPDLRPVPGGGLSSIAYGILPPRLLAVVRDRFLALSRQRKAQRVPRTE